MRSSMFAVALVATCFVAHGDATAQFARPIDSVGQQSATEASNNNFYRIERDVATTTTGEVSAQPVSFGCSSGCTSGCASTGGCLSCCGSAGGCMSGCNGCCGDGGILGLVRALPSVQLAQQLPCCGGDPWSLFPESCRCIKAGGWFQGGYHDESTTLFNQHPDRLNLHQGWLWVEREAKAGPCCWDWGFRADIMYGVDAADTQAFGNTPGRWDYLNGWDRGAGYGWALPQLYFELARGNWSVKAGHFFTLVGYETVTAPDNFFYSHAFTMYNSEPFTHTGVLGTYQMSDNLEIYAGWTLGWDTGYDLFDGSGNFLGGFSASLTDNLSLTYITTIGDFGWRGQGYSHSVVFDLAVTDNLNYVLQSDLVSTTQARNDDQFGINQYLFYTLTDCVAVGGRMEWWKSDGISTYAATGGINYRPVPNFVLRPEARQQWTPALDYDETILGIDAIVTF